MDEKDDKRQSYQTNPGVENDYYRQPTKAGQKRVDAPKDKKSRRGLKLFLRLSVISFLIVVILGLATYFYFLWQLPPMNKVTDYRPTLTTQIFSADVELIGEYYKQYRHLTALEDIPPAVRKAFIAAEDARFFEHSGIDYLGIMRAMVRNIQAGSVRQGGSTITQQVARSLLLTREKTLTRKIKEALLSFRIERKLSKAEILYLYLNQIYLGHGAYGVAAGSQVYFNKDLNQLTLGEIALLAGMPRAPSRDNPFVHPERARKMRANVLRKMFEMGFINQQQRQQAHEEPFILDNRARFVSDEVAPHFTEHVRRYLLETYGEEMLYSGGLRVYTSLSLPMQRAAQDAVRWNLHQVDRRQGFRGAIKTLNAQEAEAYKTQWELRQKDFQTRYLYPEVPALNEELSFQATKIEALVDEVDDKKMRVKVYTNDHVGWIPFALMKWARTPNVDLPPEYDKIRKPSQALKKGDWIYVRKSALSELPKAEQESYTDERLFALDQQPAVEGAIIALDPENGLVKAMVGGYDYQRSEFNRVVQAKRQPGSAFKPILYAAALDRGYTPASLILDAPVVYDDPLSDKVWRPKNYSGTFRGDVLFRTALIKSLNVVSVKILQDIGIDYTRGYAKKLGIESELTRDSTLALGSSVVAPIEMTKAYTTFATGGVPREPIFIQKILDRDGRILEQHTFDDPAVDLLTQVNAMQERLKQTAIESVDDTKGDELPSDELPAETASKDASRLQLFNRAFAAEPPADQTVASSGRFRVRQPDQIIREETAYIMTHIMSEVVQYGTGWRAKALGRPSAGKTGTTNENIDAWYIGFTPNLIATAWVGFDEKRSLGKLETGTRAASPMWLYFMQRALKEKPVKAFRVPGGITFAKIDPTTGKLATDKTTTPILEAFAAGTEPTDEESLKEGGAKEFFLEE